MGIIQRQSIKYSLVNYLGVGLGMINVLFVAPLALNEYGLLQVLIATATLSVPFASIGSHTLAVRFFPNFRNPGLKHSGFLGFLLTVASTGYFLFTGAVILLWDPIFGFFTQKDPGNSYLPQFLVYFVPLAFLVLQIHILSAYISNFHRIVWPAIVHELFLKVAMPILTLLFVWQLISVAGLVKLLLGTYAAVVFMLIGYLASLGEFHLKTDWKKIRPFIPEMARYAAFSSLGSIGSLLAFQIGVVMLGGLKGEKSSGIFSLNAYISNTIDIPQRAIQKITAPIIAKAIQEQNQTEVRSIYKKTSINLSLAGIGLLILIWFNLDNLLNILPSGDTLRQGKYVILILGIGKITDLITGINGHIIFYSKYYRSGFYLVLVLGLLNVVFNHFLIPLYGVNGAALGSALALVVYNLLKTLFVYHTFRLHPFSIKTLYLLLITGLTVGLAVVYPSSGNNLLDIVLRSLLLGGIFGGTILYFRVSEDLNHLVGRFWKRW